MSAFDTHRRELQFNVGDKVWVVLTKDRFPPGTYNKLKAHKIGHLDIIEKINNNDNRLRIPPHMKTANVFNVKHLVPFEGDDYIKISSLNFCYSERSDVASL